VAPGVPHAARDSSSAAKSAIRTIWDVAFLAFLILIYNPPFD
jgi:hypothetical protein